MSHLPYSFMSFFYNNPLNQNLLNIHLCVRAIQWDMGHLSMATIPKMSGFFKNSQQPSVSIISPTRHGASGAPPPSLHTGENFEIYWSLFVEVHAMVCCLCQKTSCWFSSSTIKHQWPISGHRAWEQPPFPT